MAATLFAVPLLYYAHRGYLFPLLLTTSGLRSMVWVMEKPYVHQPPKELSFGAES